MSRTVYTKEIMDVLEVEAKPMTMDDMLDREIAIEKRWLEQFRDHEKMLEHHFELRDGIKAAQAKIGEAAQSALHTKGVVIPSLYLNQGPQVNPEATVEIIDAAVTYIEMGRDFEVILQAIKDNPTLKSEWDRFMMFLRMAQED
jgi:hypothetical protein